MLCEWVSACRLPAGVSVCLCLYVCAQSTSSNAESDPHFAYLFIPWIFCRTRWADRWECAECLAIIIVHGGRTAAHTHIFTNRLKKSCLSNSFSVVFISYLLRVQTGRIQWKDGVPIPANNTVQETTEDKQNWREKKKNGKLHSNRAAMAADMEFFSFLGNCVAGRWSIRLSARIDRFESHFVWWNIQFFMLLWQCISIQFDLMIFRIVFFAFFRMFGPGPIRLQQPDDANNAIWKIKEATAMQHIASLRPNFVRAPHQRRHRANDAIYVRCAQSPLFTRLARKWARANIALSSGKCCPTRFLVHTQSTRHYECQPCSTFFLLLFNFLFRFFRTKIAWGTVATFGTTCIARWCHTFFTRFEYKVNEVKKKS